MRQGHLGLLANTLYEYRKGVRNLFLFTVSVRELKPISRRLEDEAVAYYVQPVSEAKANLFFGRAAYVETARALASRPLNRLSPEQDFILGTLLGYDREQQCRRFLARIGAGAQAAE